MGWPKASGCIWYASVRILKLILLLTGRQQSSDKREVGKFVNVGFIIFAHSFFASNPLNRSHRTKPASICFFSQLDPIIQNIREPAPGSPRMGGCSPLPVSHTDDRPVYRTLPLWHIAPTVPPPGQFPSPPGTFPWLLKRKFENWH